jgi:LytS/YehU family sensor histidine kinase
MMMKKMKAKNKSYLITGVGIAVGLIAGYAYYYFVGCASGTCSITSKPLNSTLYGGMMGGLLFNIFVPSQQKDEKNDVSKG